MRVYHWRDFFGLHVYEVTKEEDKILKLKIEGSAGGFSDTRRVNRSKLGKPNVMGELWDTDLDNVIGHIQRRMQLRQAETDGFITKCTKAIRELTGERKGL